MSIVKDYEQLNKFANEIINTISSINSEYLKENIQYLYEDIFDLTNKYNYLKKKVAKKHYS